MRLLYISFALLLLIGGLAPAHTRGRGGFSVQQMKELLTGSIHIFNTTHPAAVYPNLAHQRLGTPNRSTPPPAWLAGAPGYESRGTATIVL